MVIGNRCTSHDNMTSYNLHRDDEWVLNDYYWRVGCNEEGIANLKRILRPYEENWNIEWREMKWIRSQNKFWLWRVLADAWNRPEVTHKIIFVSK